MNTASYLPLLLILGLCIFLVLCTLTLVVSHHLARILTAVHCQNNLLAQQYTESMKLKYTIEASNVRLKAIEKHTNSVAFVMDEVHCESSKAIRNVPAF